MGAALKRIQPTVPNGWYPAPDRPGQLRYWDGAVWTEDYMPHLVAPTPIVRTPLAASKLGCFPKLLVWATAVAIVVVVGALINSWSTPNDKAESTSSIEQEPAPIPEKSAADIRDEAMTAQGFHIGQTGDVYYKTLETGTYSCGSFRCLSYSVLSIDGCSAGIYVAASIEDGDVSVGKTNAITAGLQAEQVAIVRLDDYTNSGSSFRVTEVKCLG